MFEVTKNARIAKDKASLHFSTVEVAAMKSEPGNSNYYYWAFQTPIVGCGNVVPEDYDPTKRNAFKLEDGYSLNKFTKDLKTLHDGGIKLQILVAGFNRGVDLALRAEARPTPKAKMDEADKIAFICANHGDLVEKLVADGEFSTANLVKAFNELEA